MTRKQQIFSLAGLLSFALLAPLAGNSSGLVSLTSLVGQSGRLRALFALPGERVAAAADVASRKPGVYKLINLFRSSAEAFHLIVMKPFSAKVHGRIGSYRLGDWPFERREPTNPIYANPRGFVEVTPDNLSTHLSEHFTLGQFITKDQLSVWPKYVVLEPRLLDKLELTIEELRREGHPVRGLFVMSGFRTPEYNEQGVGAGGRSGVSRHQYGDAADVYPDDHGQGTDGRLERRWLVDLRDARILAIAAETVEREHPELAGGIGIYPATGAHGPFVHIDARGTRARW